MRSKYGDRDQHALDWLTQLGLDELITKAPQGKSQTSAAEIYCLGKDRVAR
jgi:hypothetical protein